MTCWSCLHYRPGGCDLELPGFSEIGVNCPVFSYEPGSDAEEALQDALGAEMSQEGRGKG